MRRPLWFALLALACAHSKPVPTPAEVAAEHDRLVLEHHIIDLSLPAHGGRCTARVVPLEGARCATSSLAPGSAKVEHGTVACGQTVTLCGHALACNCAHPLPVEPCRGREVRGFGYYGTAPDGSSVFTFTQPPSDGVCELTVTVSRGAEPPQEVSSFSVFGETLATARDKRCRCEDFQ